MSDQTPGIIKPAKYTLAAATATAMPMLSGTAAYVIQNNDAATIYYGVSAAVDATTGVAIIAGAYFPVTLTSGNGGAVNYLYSAAGTSSNAVAYQGSR